MWMIAAFALAGAPPTDASANDKRTEQNIVDRRTYLTDDDLLLFSLQLDQLTLTETLNAHGDQRDPLLPVGELSRLLDLDIDVSAADQRASGTLGEARRQLLIDLPKHLMRINGQDVGYSEGDVGLTQTDLYVRASILQRLLPIHFDIDDEALAIVLKPVEKLPIQSRMDRIARSRSGGSSVEDSAGSKLSIKSPYRLFAPPSFDVALDGGRDPRTQQSYSGRYDVRAAGDLFFSNFQGYVGSDNNGRLNAARVSLERRSNSGFLPLGLTRLSAGDVFTPALGIGPRSFGGAGLSFTTAPLDQASVFDTIDLRGELPLGYDVELYVNDVLRGSQDLPVQGRYEFLRVPLVRGQNVIRIVTYGPRGERQQVVRVINVGGGQVPKHRVQVDFGLVRQGRDLIDLRPRLGRADPSFVEGTRGVLSVTYGATENLTLIGGAAQFPISATSTRRMLTGGVRTSILGLAFQADGAIDNKGGIGGTLGLAGQLIGVSTIIQHAEYRSGFVDEVTGGSSLNQRLVRHTSVNFDFSLPEIAHKRLPLSIRVLRDQFDNGDMSYVGSARTSVTAFDTFLSTGVDIQRTKTAHQRARTDVLGNFSAAKFVDFKWQLRASTNYQILPTKAFRDISITADRALSEALSARFGVGRSFGASGDTFAQAGATVRVPIGELAISTDYSLAHHDLRLSARLAFGSIFNPLRHRYVLTPPGPASGGSVVFRAFVDQDGDGRFSKGDTPVEKVALEGGQHPTATGTSGIAVTTGLGVSPTAALRVDTKDIADLGVEDGPTNVEFPPRPGKVVTVDYPLEPVAEIYARFVTRQSAGPVVGLSALHVRLVSDVRGGVIPGTTEFDGSVVFSGVRPGGYRLELDPDQAARLNMHLEKPVKVLVKEGDESQITSTVIFDRSKSETEHKSQEVSASD